MKSTSLRARFKTNLWLYSTLSLSLILVLLTSCSSLTTEESPSVRETQLELSVRQTLAAQDKTNLNLDATAQAQKTTQDAISQITRIAQQASPTSLEGANTALQTVESPIITPAASQSVGQPNANTPEPTPVSELNTDLAAWMKSAQILLYEDMVGNLDTNRYVKDTLDRMGLTYTDIGSAKGWLQTQVASPAPNGNPWDLVIIAAETKASGFQGDFFNYANDLLDKGASVIFEVWYLDKVASGAASTLLARCGIEWEKDWSKVPASRLVMFPLNDTNPILTQPNVGLSFTKVTNYWYDPKKDIDVGDWVQITSSGDAQLLVGLIANDNMTHGTVTTCIQNRLILQTFSSHTHSFDSMTLVWENYIYNALKTRFEGLSK